MVKIAVAGGSGQVAQEVLEVLQASKKHDITVLSKKKMPMVVSPPDINWRTVNYNDKRDLAEALRGVHTVLSFIQVLSDANQIAQRNLIDAAINAGVKRFAPSEYGSKGLVDMPWWNGKEKVREYLKEVNEKADTLEYTLFQPGLFLDYLAFPNKTAKYVDPLQSVFDFKNRRAMVVEGREDAIMTLTTVADLAAVVARAVEYDGRWPTTGGIGGNRLTFSQIFDIATRVRGTNDLSAECSEEINPCSHSSTGSSFTVEKLRVDDLEAGVLKTSWGLEAVHHAVSDDQASALLKDVAIGILLSSLKGAWDISDELNQLFPDYEFTRAESFLAKAWEGKP
ncbi:MAG: hypothetical protein M1822_000166 [Bathelium mastoideum]|nr:MAG: hypothetical protein M1822_000166 [Bathelium mastoideum]